MNIKNRNNQVYSHFYNQNMNNKKISSMNKKTANAYSVSIENSNQKSNQIIIEETDENNEKIESTESNHDLSNEMLNEQQISTFLDNQKGPTLSNFKKNNSMSTLAMPFSSFRNGKNKNYVKNSIFSNENSSNNLILLSEDY